MYLDVEKKGMFDVWEWVYKRVFLGVKELWLVWKKFEYIGVYAEMLIVRVWMVQIVIEGKYMIVEVMVMFKGCIIMVFQFVCWCCVVFMKYYGIVFFDEGKFNKLLIGWCYLLVVFGGIISNDQMCDFSWGEVMIDQFNMLFGF